MNVWMRKVLAGFRAFRQARFIGIFDPGTRLEFRASGETSSGIRSGNRDGAATEVWVAAQFAKSDTAFPLVPELHLGTYISPKLRFTHPLRAAEVQLRQQGIPK